MNLYFFIIFGVTLQLCASEGPLWRISHGKEAIPHEFPFIISLQQPLKSGINQHQCGGSIITPRWILTAGHCWMNGNLLVVAGAHNLKKLDTNVQIRKVVKFITHPAFNTSIDGPQKHDIALLKLDRELDLNQYVKVVHLSSNRNPKGITTITGWGWTSDDAGESSPILMKAQVPIITTKECLAMHNNNPTITSNVVCAGDPKNGADTCSGDSGGPLVQLNQHDEFVLIGLTSWGDINCNSSVHKPGVYTSVAKYTHWITNIVKQG